MILGPTAAGKTKLAVRLAARFNGEIISADSRQVYRGMDIGTGKDLEEYDIKVKSQKSKVKINNKIKYHLIDIVSPKSDFNVAKYQRLAYRAIDDILERGKQPFLVGGAGLYIDAVIKGYRFSPPAKKCPMSNVQCPKIRNKLNLWSHQKLLNKLKQIDPRTYNTIDKKNRRRVQRAVEIYYETGRPKSRQPELANPDYDILIIGVKYPLEKIYEKIDQRLKLRLEQGMITEVKRLHQAGTSWKKLESFGLEYKQVALYLQGKLDYEQMFEQLKNAIHHFAKRQLTWFKRNEKIIWSDDYLQPAGLVKKFLEK